MYDASGKLNSNEILKQHLPMVSRMAHHLMARVPANVEVDDLIQMGMIGLAEAISRYDSGHGVPFEAYASQRIRGAMIDELRGHDWLSRGSRKHQKDIEKVIGLLEHRLGRSPTDGEIAAELTIPLGEYHDRLNKAKGAQLIYLEDLDFNNDEGRFLDRNLGDTQYDPLTLLQSHKLREALIAAIKTLPEREQYVMSMYYEQDMNLKEIAAVLEVTESRISQMHSQSMARLRVKLRQH